MGKWVVKTAADYENALRHIQQTVDKSAALMKQNVMRVAIDFTIGVTGRAMELAPVREGNLRAASEILINGAYIKYPGEKQMPPASAVNGFAGLDRLEAEFGWRGPIVKTKAGKEYNLAFIQHEHVEFEHKMGGQAKFLQTALEEHESHLRGRLEQAARAGWEGE